MIQLGETLATDARFFDGDVPSTVREVMLANLAIDQLAFEGDPISPTPLDAWRLREGGYFYDDKARAYMDDQLHKMTMPELQSIEELNEWIRKGQGRISPKTARSAAREMWTQHDLKQLRNDQAVSLLHTDTTEVDPETAEHIMQVRAGTASLETYFRFLARFQEVGGVEVMKASRPFDPHGTELARAQFTSRLLKLNHHPNIVAGVERYSTYYRQIEIEDPRIVVLKTHLANIAMRGLPQMEVVVREAGVILHQEKDDLSMTYRIAHRPDGSRIHVAPIALTGYVRLTSRQ